MDSAHSSVPPSTLQNSSCCLYLSQKTTNPHLHGLVNGDVGKKRLFNAFKQLSEEGHDVQPHAFRILRGEGGVGGERSECRGVRDGLLQI